MTLTSCTRRFTRWLAVVTALVGTACRALGRPTEHGVTAGTTVAKVVGVVGVVPVAGLVQKPANLFDLEGKTLRFVRERGGYAVRVSAGTELISAPTVPSHPDADREHPSWN